MILQGLRVSRQLVDDIANVELTTETVVHERLRRIKDHDVASTGATYPKCRCESIGLRAGITVDQLLRLGSGCTGNNISGSGYVCPRLILLRRKYGH